MTLPVADDARETLQVALNRSTEGLQPAKHDAFQESCHRTVAVTLLATVATGLIMLAKIATTFRKRDPSLLPEPVWGVTYVIQGLGAMLLVLLFLVTLHICLSLVPCHCAYLASIILDHGPELARKE